MTTLLAVNVFIFLFLSVIWKREDLFNLFLKVTLFSAFVANLIFLLIEMGFVIASNSTGA